MSDNVLLQFLRNGLIDFQGDDEKLARLSQASDSVAAHLRQHPSELFSFVYAAIDPDIGADDPAILKAREHLEEVWPTHVNTFADSPVLAIRAMILNALISNASQNDAFADTLNPIVTSALPRVDSGSEGGVWMEAILEIRTSSEARAQSAWAAADAISVPRFQFEGIEPIAIPHNPTLVNESKLSAGLSAAAGPHGTDGQTGEGRNRHWPNGNQNWVDDFSEIAAQAIKRAVDPALKAPIGPIQPELLFKQLTDAIEGQIQHSLERVAEATKGLQLRTQLVWWKEAFYSPSVLQSYRDMDPVISAGLMAFDLQSPLPSLTPLSVEAFLRETVCCHPDEDAEAERSVEEILRMYTEAKELAPLRQYVSSVSWEDGRRPLISVIREGGDVAHLIEVGTPFDPMSKVTMPDMACWIFLELQALKSLNAVEPEKTRKRKGPKK